MNFKFAIGINLFSVAYNTGMAIFNYTMVPSEIKIPLLIMNITTAIIGIIVSTILILGEIERRDMEREFKKISEELEKK